MKPPAKSWHTLVRGPENTPVPYQLADKERTSVRDVPGARLYECEAHAWMAIKEHYTPMPPGSQFIPWKQSTRLFVLPAKRGAR